MVRAALDLVLELGPSDLTFARLAERVSMVPASIAHRFGSRDNLIVEISNEVTRRYEAISNVAVKSCDGVDSVVAFLVEICRAGATPASVINQVSLMQIELSVPALSADVARRSNAVSEALLSLLKGAAAAKELTCEDLDALAAALHDTQVGALLNWCVNPAGDLRARVERNVRFVLAPFLTGAVDAASVRNLGDPSNGASQGEKGS